MRKEYGKALRDLFAARMKAELPDWRSVPAPKPWYWPGERIYVRDAHPGVWLAIVLEPDLKDHDAFDLEIGWSARGRVPELSMRPCPDDPSGDKALERDEYLCRLGSLCRDKGGAYGGANGWVIDPRTYSTDPGKIIAALVERQARIGAEQARSAVSPFVEDAVAVLRQCGIPYLEARLPLIAARHSNTLLETAEQRSRTA